MVRKRILIVGGGGAGSAAAQALQQAEPNVEVVVVGAEDQLPYNRTTVNKGLLSGAVKTEDIGLPGMDLPGVHWQIGRRAVGLNTASRTVELDDGRTIDADAVLLAPGAAPRKLPASVTDENHTRVVTLRNLADTHRLRELIDETPRRIVIAGAGLIGTETAGVLLGAGCGVTLTDPSSLPMQNQLGATVAEWVARAHSAAGVDFRAASTVSEVRAAGENLRIAFDGGSHLEADILLVSFGVAPATHWLDGSGIPLQGGARPGAILVDGHQRVEGIRGLYAAGDAAAVPGADGIPVRIEHWGVALAQGRSAAAAILNDLEGLPYQPLPASSPTSYSTYVHDTKLTIVGTLSAGVREQFILGDVTSPRFAVAFFDTEDRITGAVGVGGARAVNQLRPFIARRAAASEIDAVYHAEKTGRSQ
ncbi:NAD(P)/FAD-dependent oxidoreductase [Arthrobacter pigmenti]